MGCVSRVTRRAKRILPSLANIKCVRRLRGSTTVRPHHGNTKSGIPLYPRTTFCSDYYVHSETVTIESDPTPDDACDCAGGKPPPPCPLQRVYFTGSNGPFVKPYRVYNTYLNAVCLPEQTCHLLPSPARQKSANVALSSRRVSDPARHVLRRTQPTACCSRRHEKRMLARFISHRCSFLPVPNVFGFDIYCCSAGGR